MAQGPEPMARVHQTLYSPIKGIHVESEGFWWSARVGSEVTMSTARVEKISDKHTKAIANGRPFGAFSDEMLVSRLSNMIQLYLA